MALCYSPFEMSEGLRGSLEVPPATLLVLPNGWVKVAAALPYICADLRKMGLAEAWRAYCGAWHDAAIVAATTQAIDEESQHAIANRWRFMAVATT
jgi:hypothetical protein